MSSDSESFEYLLSWGAYGAIVAGAFVLITRYCLTGTFISAEMIRRKLEFNLNKDMSEEERLRRALRWEMTKLLFFGGAEVFDIISDWFSIVRMQEEVKESGESENELCVYAFLGGCSFLVASYALLQRASIQSVINEQIHNDYIGSLAQGSNIKEVTSASREESY